MKRAFGSWNKFYTSLNVSWENKNSVPQRYTENISIFRQKFLTYNVTIPSLRTTGISVHSCDFSLELKCSIFFLSPSLSVNGTLIFVGSDSFTSCEHEKLIIGPKINASMVWSMLSASWYSSLEKRQSHQTLSW